MKKERKMANNLLEVRIDPRWDGPVWLLMKTFKEKCDEMGAQYDIGFLCGEFDKELMVSGMIMRPFLFGYHLYQIGNYSLNMHGRTAIDSFTLPQQWDEALKAVKQFLNNKQNKNGKEKG